MSKEGYVPFFGKEILSHLRGENREAKRKIATKLAEAYHHNFFNRQEQQVADDILRALVKDSDETLRQNIATILKDNLLLPYDVVMALATDVADTVACPMLESSYLLSEEDLAELIDNNVSSPRLEAIARREALSARVASALLLKRVPQVMTLLFKNNSAPLREEDVITSLEGIEPSEELMNLAAQRKEMGPISQQKLKVMATKAGFNRFSQSLDTNLQPEALVEAARLYSLLGMTLEQVKGEGMPQLVNQLAMQGRLSISLLLRSLCIGELSLVEHSLAQLANIPIQNARILIRDKGGRGVEALYKKSKMPDIYSGVFSKLIRLLLTDPELKTLHPRLLQRHLLIAVADDKNEEVVEFTSAIIKRAAQDLEEAEEHFGGGEPLAGGELPKY